MKLHERQARQRAKAKKTIRQRVKDRKLGELSELQKSLIAMKLEVRTKPYNEARVFTIKALEDKIDGLRMEL